MQADDLMYQARRFRGCLLAGWLAVAVFLFANSSIAIEQEDATQQLKKADALKSSNYSEFAVIVKQLSDQSSDLSPPHLDYLRYLQGWKHAYEGDYQAAVRALKEIAADSKDITLRFRASATMVNVLVLTTQYEEAFSQFSQLLELLPQVSDKGAREQGLGVAAYLYNHVGEYDLSLRYAKTLSEENWGGRGVCTGGQLELQALYKSAKLTTVEPKFRTVIDACNKLGEPIRAIAVRTYEARWLMDGGRFDDAIQELKEHYDEVKRVRSPQIASEYDSLLAQAYRQTGNAVLAHQFALSAIESSVKNEYTEPLVTSYRLLYLLAKEQGDSKLALMYHEKYTAADKGYLDDVSAQQLAYQRVKHEVVANQLQIDALNKQNQVLQLQRQLSDKAMENIRLYVALLTVILVSIALWAYKTKRSQLHFMKLSRHDGLTGIFNRPHFIDQAERALESSKKAGQEVCVAVCDLDHFKSINDSWGHAAGDVVLKQTGSVFLAHLRKNDVVGRLGGEEFGILLVDCDLAIARQRCEQLRAALAEIAIRNDGTELKLSASFGIAATASSGHEFRQLLAHADAALYKAKRGGRNRVVLYDEKNAFDVPVSNVIDVQLHA